MAGVSEDVFVDAENGHGLRAFDDKIANSLPDYEYEYVPESELNPACKIWKDKDFDHSVDLCDFLDPPDR